MLARYMGSGTAGILFIVSLLISAPFMSLSEGSGTRDVTATVSGNVVDGVASPITGVTVIAIFGGTTILNATWTNASGEYEMEIEIPSGPSDILFVFQKDGYFEGHNETSVSGGSNNIGEHQMYVIPTEDEQVSGTVVDTDGSPVANAEVMLEYNGVEGRHEYNNLTGTGGGFSFIVFPGEYHVSVKKEGIDLYGEEFIVEDGSGNNVLSIEVPIIPPLNSSIEGYVADGSSPVVGVVIMIHDLDLQIRSHVLSGPDGYFQLDIWPGNFMFITMFEGYASYHNTIEIEDGANVWNNFSIQKLEIWINGTVNNMDSYPIENMSVQFAMEHTFLQANSVKTDVNGEFSINLPQGKGFLFAMEDDPFETENYDIYFSPEWNLTEDTDVDITLFPAQMNSGLITVIFDNWTSLETSSRMRLPLNSSKAVRTFVDSMMGNCDFIVSEKEEELFRGMLFEDNDDLKEGPFGDSTQQNMTINGNHFDLVPDSLDNVMTNLSGPVQAESNMELQMGSEYGMNGTLEEDTYSIDLLVNSTYREDNEDIKMYLPIPNDWMYLEHSTTTHEMTVEDGSLVVIPGNDPDKEDEIDWEIFTITFVNDSFSAEIEAPDLINEGEEITLNATFIDHIPANSRNYSWEIGSEVANTTLPYLNYSFLENGTYDITLTMTDGQEREFKAFKLVEVLNKAPTVEMMVVGGTNRTFHEGDVIEVKINISDVDADPLLFQWGVQGEWGEARTDSVENRTFEITIPDDGNFTVQVKVMDDDGGFTFDNITVCALNLAPDAAVNLVGLDEFDQLPQGTWMTFNITTFDVPSDTVTVDWQWPGLPSIETESNGSDLNIRFLDPGDHTILVRIFDEDGGEVRRNWTIQVVDAIDFDNDEDGMPRWWETLNSLDDDDPSDASEDPDLDGLINLHEFLNGTDPLKIDTDDDGMPDKFEIDTVGLDPTDDDSAGDLDLDGVSNLDEYLNGSDPTDPNDPKGNDDEYKDNTPLFLILIMTGLLLALGTIVLILTRRKQNSLEYEE